MRRLDLASALAAALPALAGCQGRAEEKQCTEALLAGRAAATHGDLDGGAAALEAARSACPKGRSFYVERLGEELDAKRAAAERRAREVRAEEERRRQEPLREFVAWATERTSATRRRDAATTCVPRGEPGYGFCETPASEGRPFAVRFLAADPSMVTFTATSPAPVDCADLGPHRLVRRWLPTDGGSRTHAYCEITGGGLKGFGVVLVGEGAFTRVTVFSPGMPQHSKELRALLEASRGR